MNVHGSLLDHCAAKACDHVQLGDHDELPPLVSEVERSSPSRVAQDPPPQDHSDLARSLDHRDAETVPHEYIEPYSGILAWLLPLGGVLRLFVRRLVYEHLKRT